MKNHFGKMALVLVAAAVMAIPASAQRHQTRNWDNGHDHSSRDKNWDRGHNFRAGAVVTDYPDYSSWNIQGGLYPVSAYQTDVVSTTPWRHCRAQFFAHASLNLGGHNYVRTTVNRNGRQYYSFKAGRR